MNGDGFADILVAAFTGDSAGNGQSNAGEAYVVFGKADSTTVNLSDIEAGTGGGFVSSSLSPGSHTITLSVTEVVSHSPGRVTTHHARSRTPSVWGVTPKMLGICDDTMRMAAPLVNPVSTGSDMT